MFEPRPAGFTFTLSPEAAGWTVKNGEAVLFVSPNIEAALDRARQVARAHAPSSLTVYDRGAVVLAEWHYDADADDTIVG